MNLEINVENHLTYEISNLKNLNIYKIFLILRSNNNSINLFFEEINRDLEKDQVKFNLVINEDKISNLRYKLYLLIFHKSKIFEEIFLDDISLISKSQINLVGIPINTHSIDLKEKTYEVEIPLDNIVLKKQTE